MRGSPDDNSVSVQKDVSEKDGEGKKDPVQKEAAGKDGEGEGKKDNVEAVKDRKIGWSKTETK